MVPCMRDSWMEAAHGMCRAAHTGARVRDSSVKDRRERVTWDRRVMLCGVRDGEPSGTASRQTMGGYMSHYVYVTVRYARCVAYKLRYVRCICMYITYVL